MKPLPSDLKSDLEIEDAKRKEIVSRLLKWYRANRRDLPWRGASPYAVWVSEIMLQQTQAATVIPYYTRFLERFPTVEALATTPIDEVMRYWAGLGYYARVRNLHLAARLVTQRHHGRVPDTYEEVAALPGVGRYTAGAILSIAYDRPFPLVDGNVIRVLSRLFGLGGDPKSAANQAALWSLAGRLVPQEAPGDFNQGLMELGALVCTPTDPRCDLCPLLATPCVGGNSADPTALPQTPPGRSSQPFTHSSVLIRDGARRVLISQRPLHGLWGGLWEFPRVVCAPGETPQEGALRAAREVAGLEVRIEERVGRIKHSVTHHRITLYGFAACLVSSGDLAEPIRSAALLWERLEALDDYPFSAPQAQLRAAIQKMGARSAAATQADLQPALVFEEPADYDSREEGRGKREEGEPPPTPPSHSARQA